MRALVSMALVAAVAAGCVGAAAPASLSQPLLGGAPTAPGAYPATGALRVSFAAEPPRLLCAATLVSPTVAVTAAHCFIGLGDRLPELVLSDELAPTDAAMHARAVALDPDFVVQPAAGAPGHDLAVVLLAARVTSLPAAPLADPLASDGDDAPSSLTVIAYGPIVAGADGGRKNAARVNVLAATASELVVGAPDASACTGDSGGAAYATHDDGSQRLAAIVSRADDPAQPCGGGTRMTRVDAHADWIAQQVAAEQARDGGCTLATGRPQCDGAAPLALLAGLIAARRRRYVPRLDSVRL